MLFTCVAVQILEFWLKAGGIEIKATSTDERNLRPTSGAFGCGLNFYQNIEISGPEDD